MKSPPELARELLEQIEPLRPEQQVTIGVERIRQIAKAVVAKGVPTIGEKTASKPAK